MAGIQPVPLKDIQNFSFTIQEWFRKIQDLLVSGGLAWTLIDFTGSNITDILTRNHNDLQNIQGGAANDYYHLTNTQKTDLTDGGDTTLHYHSADRSDSFKTIAVSGQSDVVADSQTDTLTLAAGSNITLTTNASTDTVTFAASQPNTFGTIAVSGQSDIVADSSTDTLTIAAGSNITLTTNASSDTLTIAASGGGISSGTSFPGSPSNNDLFYRTDLDLLCFYDSGASQWRTVNQYMMCFSPYTAFANAISATNTSLLNANIPFVATYNLWLETIYVTTFVTTTTNATNYWTVDVTKFPATGAGTSLGSFDTKTDTGSNFTQHTIAVNAALGTTFFWIVLGATKTLSPGTFYCTASLSYRLIVT